MTLYWNIQINEQPNEFVSMKFVCHSNGRNKNTQLLYSINCIRSMKASFEWKDHVQMIQNQKRKCKLSSRQRTASNGRKVLFCFFFFISFNRNGTHNNINKTNNTGHTICAYKVNAWTLNGIVCIAFARIHCVRSFLVEIMNFQNSWT